jgi:hypothetical protein
VDDVLLLARGELGDARVIEGRILGRRLLMVLSVQIGLVAIVRQLGLGVVGAMRGLPGVRHCVDLSLDHTQSGRGLKSRRREERLRLKEMSLSD